MKQLLLSAARADSIPPGTSGLWSVQKLHYPSSIEARHLGKIKTIPAGDYTWLGRPTMATLHQESGEGVMHDTPEELRTHLDFMMRARGNVLITGLGLGCVVRGILAKRDVRRVVVIERDRHVMRLVAPYMPKDSRLEIIEAEAVTWCKQSKEPFDWAWHDLWTDIDAGEPHLAIIHQQLLIACAAKVGFQGAWAFPRQFRRLYRKFAPIL